MRMKVKLLEDVKSFKREVYGKKDDIVAVVSEMGNILIVENKYGSRFPVLKGKTIEVK